MLCNRTGEVCKSKTNLPTAFLINRPFMFPYNEWTQNEVNDGGEQNLTEFQAPSILTVTITLSKYLKLIQLVVSPAQVTMENQSR